MNSIRFPRIISVAAILFVFISTNTQASAPDQREYLGKNLSYWIKVIHDRDNESISLAFDAIRAFGPEAQAAIPDLAALVLAPFVPIRIGKDSQAVIASKLYEIEIRAGAIDVLTSIGESAASAAVPLVRWALTPRVTPEMVGNTNDVELYIELVMADTEERMRIVGAISQFGSGASPTIAKLLTSSDSEKRKLGVAILGERALPIVAELLRSQHCDDRDLGLLILRDMDLVVATSHLDWLQQRIVCEAN